MNSETKSKVIRVGKPDDVPMGHHYAVLVYKSSSVFVPGDERSRTNPGHGYPEHYETVNDFEHWVTTDKDAWIDFVKNLETEARNRRYGTAHPYVFFEVAGRGAIKTEVVVNVEVAK